MNRLIIILLTAICLASFAELKAENREQIAKIGAAVGKKGKFKYWTKDSKPLAELKAFVADVTNKKSPNYVKPEERIAVFDLDGTLVCETAPSYFEWMMYLYRVFDDKSFKPTASQRQTASIIKDAVYKRAVPGDMMKTEAIAQNEVFANMTPEQYKDYVEMFMKEPVEGMKNLRWGEAIYLPMAEIVGYLAANDFRTYVVSGSERQVTRVYATGAMAFEPSHIIGSDAYTRASAQGTKEGWDYGFTPTDEILRGEMYVKNLKMNKVNAIYREIGVQPILAFGNSSGDFSMFEYTTGRNSKPSMAFCVLADDTEREFGNPDKAAKMKATCEQHRWTTISMKDDFETIYGHKVKVSK